MPAHIFLCLGGGLGNPFYFFFSFPSSSEKEEKKDV